MNANAMTCPTQQQLTAFSAGKLSVTEANEIEQHLAECPSCCQLLKMLPDDNTLVSLLRDPRVETRSERELGPSSPRESATLPPRAEQATVPPGDGATEFAEASPADVGLSLPEPLRVHSRYRITQLLGRGGMGDVYKAHHRMMNRPVALKVINGQLVNSHAAIQRFHREVQAAARLAHPNIVTAYDAEQAGDAHFLVMEFVAGTDLAALVRQRGPLPVAEACDYISQAAEGLQHAHELGMVHRDIKPQNLMVAGVRSVECGVGSVECGMECEEAENSTPDSSKSARRENSPLPTPQSALVKILDFGLANFATEVAIEQAEHTTEAQHAATLPAHLTVMGSMMGTPDYISPEQARDAHSADIRSDIYSLGCTLYCLLTGEPPFTGNSVLDKVMAHVEREPKPLSDYRADIPLGLEAVLRRMLAKNPAERFQTPAEVARTLAPFARPASALPWRRIGMLVAAVLIGGATLLAGIVVVATGRGRLEIQSEVDDVQISVEQNGEQVAIVDLKTGSQVKWLPTGSYELKLIGSENDITLDRRRLTMSRLGRVIVTARWNSEGRGTLASFNPPAEPITRDGVEVADGGWKITATDTRTVRLFETPLPQLSPGPFFYGAKLKTENVKGRAYLEMWARFPGQGEFFSKGFHNAVSGTNGWAEYEIPFFLKKGQQPDLVKLNLTIEGSGAVWIKDVQLRGRQVELEKPASNNIGAAVQPSDYDRLQGRWVAVSAKAGNGAIPSTAIPQWTMAFTGRNVRVTTPTSSDEGTFTLDPAKDPKEIDVEPAGGQGRLRGIYRFIGEELEVCMDDSNRKRPIQWDVDVGTRQLLVRLRRSVPTQALTDEERLQGRWVPVSASIRGKELAAEQLARMAIKLDGDHAELVDPESGQTHTGTFTVNADRTPKHITFLAPDGKEQMPGIFEFDGQRLKLAWRSARGEVRQASTRRRTGNLGCFNSARK